MRVLEGEFHVTPLPGSFVPQTSAQQGCTKLQETKSTLGVESLGLLESLFSLVMDMIRVALNKSFFFVCLFCSFRKENINKTLSSFLSLLVFLFLVLLPY